MPVVVIEDDQDTRDVLEYLLRAEGFGVRAFENAAVALDELRTGLRPSMIVVDLHMPGMSGLQFREAQVSDPDLTNIPTVMLTGEALSPDTRARLGAVHIMQKPVSPETLLETIRANRVRRV
jgi:two-component system phosphate regulon response regulator PhoB